MFKMNITNQNMIEKLIYDSICDNIAVIDQNGVIQYVNKGWLEYAGKNSKLTCVNWIGLNYLAECKRAVDLGDRLADEAFKGISLVISGAQDNFYMEYPCDSPSKKHWFLMRVSKFELSDSKLILIRHTNISERKLEEELVQEKNRAILKAIPDIMFLHDKDGNYLECFANDPSLLLHPEDQIIGSNPSQLLPKPLADKVIFYVRKTLLDRRLNQFQYEIEVNSKKMYFEARLVACRSNQVLSIVRDITEKKTAERELEKMRSRYRSVVEDQTEFICRFSPDAKLTFVNTAYCNFFGKTKEELLGKSFITLMPSSEEKKVFEKLNSLSIESPSVLYRHKVFDKFGHICWHEWIDRAIFYDFGKVLEYQSVGRDVTARVIVESKLEEELKGSILLRDEVRNKNEELERQNLELEKLNATLKLMLNYARKVELEIRERIVSDLHVNILSLLEVLKNQKLSPTACELIEALETNTKNLAHPLSNKLDSVLLGLTTREMQLATLIRQGKTNKEIMVLLNLSFQTVQSHRSNLRKKLGLSKKKINLRTYLTSEFQT